jgi:signal peptidase I
MPDNRKDPSASMRKKPMTTREKLLDWLWTIVSAWGIAFVIQLFLIGAYRIPSQSMMPQLFVGDIMMVEKVSLGSWLPVVHFKLPGFGKLSRGDVAAFVSPEWKNPGLFRELLSTLTLSLAPLDNTPENPKYLVKRFVGLPGDRLRMINGRLVRSGVPIPSNPAGSVREPVKKLSRTISVQDFELFEENDNGRKRVIQHLPGDIRFSRTEVYDFDEVVVPRKGFKYVIEDLSPFNRGLFKLLVERESGKAVEILEGHWYLRGKEITEWKPREDYYFAMGDNRDFSYDSRYFGFVPASAVFGKPVFRYFPFDRLALDTTEKPDTALMRNYGK